MAEDLFMQELQAEELAKSPILVLEDNPGAQTAIKLALKRGGMSKVSFATTICIAVRLFSN